MASLVDIVPWSWMRMRPLQLHLLAHFHPCVHPISLLVPINDLIRPHLMWWLQPANLKAGMVFPRPLPTVSIVTDASNNGWGAHMDAVSTAGTWSPSEKQLHINVLELLAVRRALTFFATSLRRQVVVVKSDNSTVVSYINRQGGTRSPQLCLQTWELLRWCVTKSPYLQSIWLGD